MSYYSDYDSDPEENDGNSESKWDPVADMNIIKSGMNLVKMITEKNEDFGPVSHVSYRKQGDGVDMSLSLVVSGAGWTMNWVNTDSEDSKSCNVVFYLTEEDNKIVQYPW